MTTNKNGLVSGIVTSAEVDVMHSSHRRKKFVGEPGRSKTMHWQKSWLPYLKLSLMKRTVVFDVCSARRELVLSF